MVARILDAIAKYLHDNLPQELIKNGAEMEGDVEVEVAQVPKDETPEGKDLVISLLRIEEETSRKAQYPYRSGMVKDPSVDGGVRHASYSIPPPLSINLDILISSHAQEYKTALSQISAVIGLMNAIKENITFERNVQDKDGEVVEEPYFKIIDTVNVSMMTLSLDQTLSLWQTLKGTIAPSVAYKVRMITVTWDKVKEEAPPVRDVTAKARGFEEAEAESKEYIEKYNARIAGGAVNPDDKNQ